MWATPHPWIPVLSAIEPPKIRQEKHVHKWIRSARDPSKVNPLQKAVQQAVPNKRLKSRNPFHMALDPTFDANEMWRKEWDQLTLAGKDLISNLGEKQPGFGSAPRKVWVSVNRLRTRVTKCNAVLS